MQRRNFLKATALGALATSATGYSMLTNGILRRQRNVLFIAVDDLKPLIGALGSTHVHTPHMDRLAAHGMIFKNNHCQQTVCGPSRVSLMTGLRPNTTKVWDLRTPMRRVIPDVVTLPQQFMAHDYTTIATGKIYDGRCVDNGHGWISQDTPSWSNPAKKVGEKRCALPRSENNPKPATECAEVPDEVYKNYHAASNGIEIMSKCATGNPPWFVGVGFNLPHLPSAAPKTGIFTNPILSRSTLCNNTLRAPPFHLKKFVGIAQLFRCSKERPYPGRLPAPADPWLLRLG